MIAPLRLGAGLLQTTSVTAACFSALATDIQIHEVQACRDNGASCIGLLVRRVALTI
jgi:hypothetical protein